MYNNIAISFNQDLFFKRLAISPDNALFCLNASIINNTIKNKFNSKILSNIKITNSPVEEYVVIANNCLNGTTLNLFLKKYALSIMNIIYTEKLIKTSIIIITEPQAALYSTNKPSTALKTEL